MTKYKIHKFDRLLRKTRKSKFISLSRKKKYEKLERELLVNFKKSELQQIVADLVPDITLKDISKMSRADCTSMIVDRLI